MGELLKKLRKLVNDGIKSGKSKADIMKELNKLLNQFDLNGQKEALFKKMEYQYDWVNSKTMTEAERKTARDILSNAGSQYTRVKTGLRSDIAARLKPLLESGKDRKVLKNELESIIGKTRDYAETIARTAIGGFDNADTFVKARKAGKKRFTYSGPPAERPFCVNLLNQSAKGKTWTEEEIHAMDNEQGLDVMIYCGGFNCRHFWETV